MKWVPFLRVECTLVGEVVRVRGEYLYTCTKPRTRLGAQREELC